MAAPAREARLPVEAVTRLPTTREADMHPFGLVAAMLAGGRPSAARRPAPPEPELPPIDAATLRSWRAWARRRGASAPMPVRAADRGPDAPRREPAGPVEVRPGRAAGDAA